METWCKCWNRKISEEKTQAIYFSHRLRLLNPRYILDGQNIPFISHLKYLGVIFDKRITWRLHIEMIEAKAFRTFNRMYSIFESEHLSTNIKLTLHKALIRSVMTNACLAWQLVADTFLLKKQRLQSKVLHTI
jgi:hypothetical protein